MQIGSVGFFLSSFIYFTDLHFREHFQCAVLYDFKVTRTEIHIETLLKKISQKLAFPYRKGDMHIFLQKKGKNMQMMQL